MSVHGESTHYVAQHVMVSYALASENKTSSTWHRLDKVPYRQAYRPVVETSIPQVSSSTRTSVRRVTWHVALVLPERSSLRFSPPLPPPSGQPGHTVSDTRNTGGGGSASLLLSNIIQYSFTRVLFVCGAPIQKTITRISQRGL